MVACSVGIILPLNQTLDPLAMSSSQPFFVIFCAAFGPTFSAAFGSGGFTAGWLSQIMGGVSLREAISRIISDAVSSSALPVTLKTGQRRFFLKSSFTYSISSWTL